MLILLFFFSSVDASAANRFRQEVTACKKIAIRYHRSDWRECVFDNPFETHEGRGLCVGSQIGQGYYGKVFSVKESQLVLKVASSKDTDLCTEQVILRFLDGMDGFAPRIFPITSKIPVACATRTLVMDRMGDANWNDIVVAFDKAFYIRYVNLLKAVQTLHDRGFVHSDIGKRNIRVKEFDPSFVALIDFGLARIAGTDPSYDRRNDWRQVARIVYDLARDTESKNIPGWVSGFWDETFVLRSDEDLDTKKWIKFFESYW
jgi:hypothetical protein